MDLDEIQQIFRESVASEVSLVSEGSDRFRVFTPFGFDDGDEFAIVLRQEKDRWVFSDEAHTYMHLSYDIALNDLRSGRREEIISNALAMFEIEDRNGELVLPVHASEFGDALFSFVHGLLRIADVSYLSRSNVLSTFITDFQGLLQATVPDDRLAFDWHDIDRDPSGVYKVDCRVNGLEQPLFFHALRNTQKTLEATIALHQFANWGIAYVPIGILDDDASVSKGAIERYSDVRVPQIFKLGQDRDDIAKFIRDHIRAG